MVRAAVIAKPDHLQVSSVVPVQCSFISVRLGSADYRLLTEPWQAATLDESDFVGVETVNECCWYR